jgi:hypothetical protein
MIPLVNRPSILSWPESTQAAASGEGFSILAYGSGENRHLSVTGCDRRDSIQDEFEMRCVLCFAIVRQI